MTAAHPPPSQIEGNPVLGFPESGAPGTGHPCPLKILLVGCGKIFRKHVEAIHKNPDCAVAGVVGRRMETVQAAADAVGARAFTDLDTALALSGAEAVSILTPAGTHAEIGVKAAGMKKHVIVEKPMALKLPDADRLIQACDANGVHLFVVKQCRTYSHIARLSRAVSENHCGKILMATARLRWCRRQSYYDAASWRGTWNQDGGVLANHASHYLDLLIWLAGPVRRVRAAIATRLAKIEAEDTAAAILEFESGAAGLIEATTAARPADLEGSISILGDRGSIEIGGTALDRVVHWECDDGAPPAMEGLVPVPTGMSRNRPPDPGEVGGHAAVYRNVVETLRGRAAPLVDGAEGKKSLGLIHALYESAETGRPVDLHEPHRGCRLCG
ncbi:Gfo/Idh/MocA family oxidoreductase [bacterium]|nr:Gfo/Idh/MocA family oxidoreductase [bacterium]